MKSERQIHDITYMGNLKNNTNEFIIKQKQTHRHSKQTYGYQRGERGGEGKIRSMGLTDTNYYCI